MADTTERITVLFRMVDQMSADIAKIQQGTSRLDRTFGTLQGRLKAGIQWSVTYGAIRQVERAIHAAADAIPDLIRRGQEWSDTVDSIQDVTGLAAGKASELAAIQRMLGGSTETLARSFAQFGRNVVENADAFKKMHVEIARNRDGSIDAYQTFQNLREAVTRTGQSLLSTAAAQKVLGRGSRDLLDLLALSNDQYALLAAQAQRAGLILSEAGQRAAHAWSITQNVLQGAITGLGAQILQRAAPALIGLTNAITQAITDNMDDIVRFVVSAINFVTGLVGQFLGIDLGQITLAEQLGDVGSAGKRAGEGLRDYQKAADGAKAAADRSSDAIKRQIDAIDRQLAALDKLERREDARREQQQLLADIRQARAELADLRTQSIFAAGMSDTELALARQRHAADIIEGEKRLADARQKLREFERRQRLEARRNELEERRNALQEQLAAQQGTLDRTLSMTNRTLGHLSRSWKGTLGKGGTVFTSMTEGMEQWANDAQRSGREVAQAIQDAILGRQQTRMVNTPEGNIGFTSRTGGLVSILQSIGSIFGQVGGFIGKLNDLLGGNLGLVAGIWALSKVVPGIPGVPIIGGGGKAEGGGGSFISRILARFPGGARGAGTVAGTGLVAYLTWEAIQNALHYWDTHRPNMGIPSGAMERFGPGSLYWAEHFGTIGYGGNPHYTPMPFTQPGQLPERFWGGGPLGAGTGLSAVAARAAFDPVFREYLGLDSELLRQQQQQTSLLSGLANSGDPTSMSVTVRRWEAGGLPVFLQNDVTVGGIVRVQPENAPHEEFWWGRLLDYQRQSADRLGLIREISKQSQVWTGAIMTILAHAQSGTRSLRVRTAASDSGIQLTLSPAAIRQLLAGQPATLTTSTMPDGGR